MNMPVLHGPDSANSRSFGSRAAGFTLLELLVVMVIIGLLAGFVAPRYFSQVGKSQVKAANAQIDALDKAIEQFRLDMNRLPTTEEGLAALNVAPANEPNWAGPYLKKDVPRGPVGPSLRVHRAGYAQQRFRPHVLRQGWSARRHRRKRRPRELVGHRGVSCQGTRPRAGCTRPAGRCHRRDGCAPPARAAGPARHFAHARSADASVLAPRAKYRWSFSVRNWCRCSTPACRWSNPSRR